MIKIFDNIFDLKPQNIVDLEDFYGKNYFCKIIKWFGKFLIFGYNKSMKYDVVIIGGGPAGLSAGIFTCRAGLKTLCLEKLGVGGQASISPEISNYPGLGQISGFDLGQKIAEDATKTGLQIEYETVEKLSQTKTCFSIKTKHNNYLAKKVILASGAKVRHLGVENEQNFIGRGVSYCASCDGAFFKGKNVAVVGGGNTAIGDVVYLSRLAKTVYLVHRRDEFRANKVDVDKVTKLKNVKIITPATVEKLNGKNQLESLTINCNGQPKTIKVDGLFVAIGYEPDLSFVDINIKKDKNGYVLVDENKQTSVKYLYACGDITSKKFKQIITACADGAIAGNSCVGE